MLHSIYDLTTTCRKTTGDVPAKLVGASTTVVGSKMYLFGGRLVTERRMVSDLYVFDLETLVWEKLPLFPEDDVPRPRYFHSADAWNNHLIVFGGMSNQPTSQNPDELCVLNDVRFFNLATRHWVPESQTSFPGPDDPGVPRARYAHLSSISSNRLFIIGGQDFYNTWLDDVCVYDLKQRRWTQRRVYPRHCGTYRSVAVSSNYVVRSEQHERDLRSATSIGSPGSRFRDPKTSPSSPNAEFTKSESLVHMPYSAVPTDATPADIYLYSNYNFTDVKRELEVFSPVPGNDFDIQDRSAAMTGSTFPPGLRFPTGAILGSHVIIAGTYLAHSYQSFSIWVLDTTTMSWSRIDPGKAVESGSWFRSCLWVEANKFMIFGNRDGNLVEDYNRRLLSWDHVAIVDLEAFGIYQPPMQKLDVQMQELGLAALEEKILADFEIVCDDGRSIACSRKTLEERWPWFKAQRKKLLETALQTVEQLPKSPMDVPLPELPGSVSNERRPDPRLTPRALNLSEPYPIAMALLQYFYSLSLITPLQHAPAVLSQLLVLASNYDIPHLASLVKHAMHRALSNATSVGVYEVATLCSCRSLQIRALKTVMSYTQKKPTRPRGERDGRDGGAGGGSGPSFDGPGGPGGRSQPVSRPRGTSDARWHQNVERSTNNFNYNAMQSALWSIPLPDVPVPLETAVQPLTPPDSPDGPPSALPSFPPPRNRRPPKTGLARSASILSVQTDDEIRAIADSVKSTVASAPIASGSSSLQRPTHSRMQSDDTSDSGPDPSISIRHPFSDSDTESGSLFYRSNSSSRYYGDSDSDYEHLSPSPDRRHSTHSGSSGSSGPSGPSLQVPRTRQRAFTGPSSSHPEYRYVTYPDKSDTPSLVSSSSGSSRSMSSHYNSPATPSLVHFPSELTIIQERDREMQNESSEAIILVPRDAESSMVPKAPKTMVNLSPPARTTSADTAMYDTSTILPLGVPSSKSASFTTKLLKPRSPPAVSAAPTPSRGSTLDLARSSSGSSTLESSAKSIKAGQKKQKKEEAKARKEELAAKFAKKRQAEEAAKAAHRPTRGKKPNEPMAAMFSVADSPLTL